MTSPLLLLFIGGITLTLGDIVFRYWTSNNTPSLYVLGLGLYLVGLMFLVRSFKYQGVAVASATLVLFNIATLAIVGWVVFKEHLNGFEIAGLLTAAAAIVLLELG